MIDDELMSPVSESLSNHAATAASLPSGAVLRDRYEILEMVGQGGMGAVYKAADRRLEGRVCAIKEILPALSVGASSESIEQLSEQFRLEASVLARLDHPNLVKVSDYFSEGAREYLVMDYVAGLDLREILERVRRESDLLPEDRVLIWADELLSALEYMHTQDPPVLHRDIKPSNIKMTTQGRLKLVDFGLVKILVPDDTQTVTVVQGRGTVAYTPLEQYGGDNGITDVRSDLYSFGATIYHLLTGEPPSDAKERFLHAGKLNSIRTANPGVSRRVEQAIMQALAMHPNERPGSAREMRDLLFHSSTHLMQNPLFYSSGAPPTVSWRDAFHNNRRLLSAALLLLLLALLLTLGTPFLPAFFR